MRHREGHSLAKEQDESSMMFLRAGLEQARRMGEPQAFPWLCVCVFLSSTGVA